MRPPPLHRLVVTAALFLLLLTACGEPPPRRGIIDPTIASLIRDFQKDAAAFGLIVDPDVINFGRVVSEDAWPDLLKRHGLASNVVGVCSPEVQEFTSAVGPVQIDRREKKIFRVLVRAQPGKPEVERWVAYHELAHCLLDAKHYDAAIDLMNAKVPNYAQVASRFDSLTRVFFERVRTEQAPPTPSD